MYHSISSLDAPIEIYALPERRFLQHVALLAESVEHGANQVVDLVDDTLAGISITFDDGYSDTLTIASRPLVENKLPFTVFVTVANITSGDSKYLTKSQLVELSNLPGATIGSHGLSHCKLGELNESQTLDELKNSKDWLEQAISKPVVTMSYPHGSYNSNTLRLVAEVGYKYATTSRWGFYQTGTSPLEIPRLDVWGRDNRRTLDQKLAGKWNLAMRAAQ